ncbi:hypothetical protein BT96DRAFT_949345 [Gymnopus androsaceus JB14]|uniref:Uncharacterized protein n=1 Tax=Gymnopus androsaceus JB14 TaxID=1447944 RepID=A0A6A4GLC4_9AGAR|nr:hypothetical protein BT96DRAFT_949345 [Gymnopus androsaceus JB14]
MSPDDAALECLSRVLRSTLGKPVVPRHPGCPSHPVDTSVQTTFYDGTAVEHVLYYSTNYYSLWRANFGPASASLPSLAALGGPPGREVVSGHPKASFALILIGGSPLPNLNP